MGIAVLTLQSNSKYENPGFPSTRYCDKKAKKCVNLL